MARSGALRFIDFGSSLFWTLAGVVSVGCTVTAINQRIRLQEEQLELMRQRNAVAEEVARLKGESEQLQGKLQLLQQQLEGASGWRWHPVWDQLMCTVMGDLGSRRR